MTVVARSSAITSSRAPGMIIKWLCGVNSEDVPPLVQQIGADPAADVRPALRQVAEQLRPAAAITVWIVPAHKAVQPGSGGKVPTAGKRAQLCRNILRNRRDPSFPVERKWPKLAVFCNWHAHCYTIAVHLVPRHEGTVQRFSGPAAPSLLLLSPPCRAAMGRWQARQRLTEGPLHHPYGWSPSPLAALAGRIFLQLAALEHLHHDVGAADELALHTLAGRSWALCSLLRPHWRGGSSRSGRGTTMRQAFLSSSRRPMAARNSGIPVPSREDVGRTVGNAAERRARAASTSAVRSRSSEGFTASHLVKII